MMKLKKLLKMICPKTKIEVVQDYDFVIKPNKYKEKGCFEVEAFDELGLKDSTNNSISG